MKDRDIIIDKIKKGILDCNNQEPFFKILLKGLMISLNRDISIRGTQVPHIVLNTGDDLMYLNLKGQNHAIEPYEISNENYVYNIVPRCIVELGGVDLLTDQVTNPYSRGVLEFQKDDCLYSLSAECRRTPIKLTVELKYYLDTYTDLLELIQHTLSKLTFIRTYTVVYMGQEIICSYKMPESFSSEHLMEISSDTTDNRCRTMNLSIELESNFPVFSNATTISTDSIISNLMKPGGNNTDPSEEWGDVTFGDDTAGAVGIKLYSTGGLGHEDPTDIIDKINTKSSRTIIYSGTNKIIDYLVTQEGAGINNLTKYYEQFKVEKELEQPIYNLIIYLSQNLNYDINNLIGSDKGMVKYWVDRKTISIEEGLKSEDVIIRNNAEAIANHTFNLWPTLWKDVTSSEWKWDNKIYE